MSEVNQAFLRAYLKNRALQATSINAAPVSTDVRTPQEPNVARPTANAPRNPPSTPIQPSQSLPSGMKLRFDPNHTNSNPLTQPPLPSSVEPAPHSQPSQARVSPTQGFWSPLGAERGMKALESTSLPAIVRNGVNAVTREAAQFRKPTTTATTATTATTTTTATTATAPQMAPVAQPVSVAQPAPKAPPVYSDEPSSRVSYDQVMYVDGLVGHAAPQRVSNSRPTEQALAEITEPIAFGTGSPSHATLPAHSTLPHSKQTAPSGPTSRQQAPAKATDASVTRRMDSSHLSNNVASATTTPAASKATEASPLNTGLPLPVAFSPSWEVDLFYWPEVVKQIETSHADAFRQIGKHLSLANRDGLKVMAITSGERGVGRSTVAMHMARCAASAGLRVALLDGDTFCPSLIDQLRLDMQQGWQDCLFENVPLHEIAIHSIADRITLFPLTCVISQQQMHANLHRMAKLIRRISNAFDMVFIDGNRLNLEQRDLVGVAQETVVDAAIVVVDTELSIKEKVDSAVSILRGMGISSIGLVENFQS